METLLTINQVVWILGITRADSEARLSMQRKFRDFEGSWRSRIIAANSMRLGRKRHDDSNRSCCHHTGREGDQGCRLEGEQERLAEKRRMLGKLDMMRDAISNSIQKIKDRWHKLIMMSTNSEIKNEIFFDPGLISNLRRKE